MYIQDLSQFLYPVLRSRLPPASGNDAGEHNCTAGLQLLFTATVITKAKQLLSSVLAATYLEDTQASTGLVSYVGSFT